MKISYFAEINLPSKNAYSIHVMKMCDALRDVTQNFDLYVFNQNRNFNIHKIYNCKNKFNIRDFKITNINFLKRIIFSIKLLNIFKKKNSENELIISRSILSGLLLALNDYKVILEIHHELSGLTKFLFFVAKNFNFFKRIKIIYISKNLQKKLNLNNSYLVLDDAVNLKDFKLKKKKVTIKNSCVYTGSFARGKGLERIVQISKILKKVKFYVYGDFSNSDFSERDLKKYPNILYKGYINYENIPKTLNKYKIVLMPYSNKVFARAKNLEITNYMSPMKLFDYMASKKIIIASNMPVYKHILNNKNSILISSESPVIWAKKISYVLKNFSEFSNLKKNAFIKVKNFTWDKRVNKIIKFSNDKFIKV